MTWKVHIYGDTNIEETIDHFARLSDAVEHVEMKLSEDVDDWEFLEDKLRLVDHNHGLGTVIHTIEEVEE